MPACRQGADGRIVARASAGNGASPAFRTNADGARSPRRRKACEPRQASSFSGGHNALTDVAQEEAAGRPPVIAPLTAPRIAREGS